MFQANFGERAVGLYPPIFDAIGAILAARRAAADAGYVAVMVSKEAVEVIKEAKRINEDMEACGDTDEGIDALSAASGRAWTLIFRDLAALLKPEGE